MQIVRHHCIFLIFICTLFQTRPINSQTSNNWFCGENVADASLRCGVACPTGLGCPTGQYCFSGVNSCSTSKRYCGVDLENANAKCSTPCPTGRGCPFGEACFLDTICSDWASVEEGGSTSSSSSSSSSISPKGTIKSFGHAAVEETFQSMKDVINTKLFLYETPDMQWLPSTVYRFDGFFDGLQLMYKQGVNQKKIYMGGNDPDCRHCHMYGLVNIAAFLAQAIKETIRYDACDENSWDRVGDKKMYPISNACGQLGQSYQDYHCKEEERFMECEVDPNMSITAVTHAKWWGAPGPLFCGPKSQYPYTGYWDFSYECNNKWKNPPEYCDAYEGQKGGKHIDDAPYANAAGRTDVEGCCWWGRGVIQTSGICNFGKLNYFLGKRAHDEGRESRYPDIDFCKDPEAICANEKYRELKWIAGFFYWVDQVQPYDSEGWVYLDELHKFVDNGMQGEAFINAVSGIVNRGCHNPPCGTGPLDGGPERAENFFNILKEMTMAWVDVVPPPAPDPTKEPTDPPYPVQTPQPISPLTPLPTLKPTKGETAQPFPLPELGEPPVTSFISPTTSPAVQSSPAQTPQLIYLPLSLSPTQSPTFESMRFPTAQSSVVTPPASESPFFEYSCGNGVEAGPQAFIEIKFAYELHNYLDAAAANALKKAKKLMLDDIARRIGCNESSNRNRNMQQTEFDESFSDITGISSSKVDEVDQDVAGCTEVVQLDTETTCTPAKGGFVLFAKPGTDQDTLNDISVRIKSIIQKSMSFGEYESGSIAKTVYIGDRVKPAPDSINILTEPEPSKTSLYAMYGLIVTCLVLLCLLCMTLRSSRRRARKQFERDDEELAFDEYYGSRSRPVSLGYNEEPEQVVYGGQNSYERNSYMHSHPQKPRSRRSLNQDDSRRSRGSSKGSRNSRRSLHQDDLSRTRSSGSSKGSRRKIDYSNHSKARSREGASIAFSRASTNGSNDYLDTHSFPPPPPRRKSTPITSRREPPLAAQRNMQAEDDSSDESSSSSSESDESQDYPPPPLPRTGSTGASTLNSGSTALSKDERRQRLEAAKARAASRRSARELT